MKTEASYIVTDIEGYTPHISRLISMMNYTRHVTIKSVNGLTIEQLDYLHDKESNTIGALLFHIAAVEFSYRIWTTEERDLTPDESSFWEAGMNLGQIGRERILGNSLEYYLELLVKVRMDTLQALKEKTDDWLEIERPFNNKPANNYFRWFHVFEDETSHRGQIRWIAKRLKIQY